MGIAGNTLTPFLARHKVVGADTMVFIYHLEDHPRYAPLTQRIFDAWESGNNSGVTSILTLLEILVKPKRLGNHQAAKDYKEVILSYPHLQVLEINSPIAELASDLRAKYHVKTPDAIQLSTALVAGATGFVTNDGFLKRVTEMEVLILDEVGTA